MSKKHMRRKILALKISFLAIIILSTLWASGIIYCTIGLSQNITALKSLANVDELAEIDLDSFGKIIPAIGRDLKGLKLLTRPIAPALRLAAGLPGIGPYLAQVDPLLVYSANISEAANLAYKALFPLLELIQSGTTTADFTPRFYKILDEGQSSLMQAAQALNEADLARDDIDPSLLPNDYGKIFARLDENFDELLNASNTLAVMPDLLGAPGYPRNYLLLAQNRDELRATGGFISGIGLLTVAGGEILSLEIGDSYLVDDFSKNYPLPPEPLQQFMLAGSWLPRDANWSPDFPTAARKAQALYTLSTDQPTDGVVAFDQEAVKTLVGIFGPLQLVDFPDPISIENIEVVMQQAWEPPDGTLDQEWWEHRKDFMPQLVNEILDKIMGAHEIEKIILLGRELLSAVKSGHILIYLNHDDAQSALVKAGLDNGIHTGDGDYLYLVDSNIGFNKTDAVIYRAVSYFVDLSDPQKIPAMLITRYTHTVQQESICEHRSSYGSGVYKDMQIRCYWDFWRVYTLPDTAVINANHTPVPGEWLLSGEDWPGGISIESGEGNTRVISGLFVLPTAVSQDISVQFLLPSRILRPLGDGQLEYTLRILKQAGLNHLPMVLQVKPPQGYQVNDPGEGWEFNQYSGFWIWTGKIFNTRDFRLLFSPKVANQSQ